MMNNIDVCKLTTSQFCGVDYRFVPCSENDPIKLPDQNTIVKEKLGFP